MTAARWLLVAGLAALAGAEFPDLTLVLQPDEDLDWNQITRWMEQPGTGPTAPGGQHSGQHGRQHGGQAQLEQLVSDPAAGASASPAAVVPGPALVPGGPKPVVPGPALVPGSSPIVTRSVLTPGLPTFRPAWRPVRPGPALLPGASPPSPLTKWTPQWPELRPGPALVPQPPPALVSQDQAVMQPTFPELERGEPLLPADAPGAHQPEPFTEPPPPVPTAAAAEGPEPATPGPALSAASADFQDLRPMPGLYGQLPPDERERYQPPDIEDYDQQPPPAQLNLAAGPPPPAELEPEQQPQQQHSSQQPQPTAAPADGGLRRLPQTARHTERSVPSRTDQPAQSPQSNVGYRSPQTQQPAGYSDQHAQQGARYSDQHAQQGAGYSDQRAQQGAGYSDQHAQQGAGYSDQRAQQETGYSDQHAQQRAEYRGQQAQLGAGYRGRASPAATGGYPGLEEYPGPRLLAQEKTPASVTEQQAAPVGGGAVPVRGAVGGAGQLPPNTLAVLLQRLEERLVANEAQQQQHVTQLRTVQHSQRKAEVVAMENMVTVRSEFRDLTTKMDNLQSDLGQMTTMLETVMTGVQGAQRTLREQAALLPPGGGAARQPAAQMESSVADLGKKLGQLVVNTALLKAGQRRLGGNVRIIENRTSELSERSEQFATQVSLASSLSEMRTYLDQQKRAPAAPASKEDEALPKDCSDVLLSGEAGSKSGIYQVLPRRAPQPIFVYCDQETDGGGWAVIQRRTNGDEDFFRDWISYKYGFGNLAGESWLGNENIHLLTSHRLNELRVDLADFPRERPGFEDYPGSNATAQYGAFALGSETEGYSLKVLDNYSGDAGDSLKYHAGMKFSTMDVDNDLWKEDSCASSHKGGWWYKGCDSSNLNGLYLSGPVPSEFEYQVAYWYDWRGPLYSLYQTQMMVRPADHGQRAAETRRRGSGRGAEDGKMAAQRRLGIQTVRARSRRRRQRRRRGRRQGQ